MAYRDVHARKVIEMGEGTLLVSMPKDWARRTGIRKGATVAVDELAGRRLMVRPIEDLQEKPKEFDVAYPGEEIRQVINGVTGAYLLGFDVIRVGGTKVISREDRAKLKAAAGRLVGLEIMDEDSKRITFQFLLESSAIVPEKIVRRMSGLLEGMLKDTAEALQKSDSKLMALVGERDDDVDRLYFLLVRATRAAVSNPEVAEGYGLAPVDIVDYRVLASFLESIGDGVSELSEKFLAGRSSRAASKEFASLVSRLVEMNDLATMAFITRRAGKVTAVNVKVGEMAKEISQKLAELSESEAAEGRMHTEAIGALERVSKLLVDVSDLAVITHTVG